MWNFFRIILLKERGQQGAWWLIQAIEHIWHLYFCGKVIFAVRNTLGLMQLCLAKDSRNSFVQNELKTFPGA